MTDASGVTQVRWTIGTTAGQNTLTATVLGLTPATFGAIGIRATEVHVTQESSVSVGTSHTCGITVSGAAYCWGYGLFGQIGNGSANASNPAPLAVAGNITFARIHASKSGVHTCGISTGGIAYCWGGNESGQLGFVLPTTCPSSTCSTQPHPVSLDLSFIAVSAGGNHSCGLLTGGSAYCWGRDGGGQVVDGVGQLVRVPGGHVFTALSASAGFTCGLTSAGDVYCWGQGLVNSAVPTALPAPQAFAALTIGDAH